MAVARFDVTEQEQLIEAVRKSEGELRQMLDLAPQLIGVLGSQGDRLYANRVALSYYGVTLDEWRQRNNGSEVHPDDVDRIKAQSLAAFEVTAEAFATACYSGHHHVYYSRDKSGTAPISTALFPSSAAQT